MQDRITYYCCPSGRLPEGSPIREFDDREAALLFCSVMAEEFECVYEVEKRLYDRKCPFAYRVLDE